MIVSLLKTHRPNAYLAQILGPFSSYIGSISIFYWHFLLLISIVLFLCIDKVHLPFPLLISQASRQGRPRLQELYLPVATTWTSFIRTFSNLDFLSSFLLQGLTSRRSPWCEKKHTSRGERTSLSCTRKPWKSKYLSQGQGQAKLFFLYSGNRLALTRKTLRLGPVRIFSRLFELMIPRRFKTDVNRVELYP